MGNTPDNPTTTPPGQNPGPGDIKQPVYDIYIWKDGSYAPTKK